MHTPPCTASTTINARTPPIRVMKLSMREPTRRDATRRDETRRISAIEREYVVACLLRAEPDSERICWNFRYTNECRYAHSHKETRDTDDGGRILSRPRYARSKYKRNTNNIKPAEFLAVRQCYLRYKGILALRIHNYIRRPWCMERKANYSVLGINIELLWLRD